MGINMNPLTLPEDRKKSIRIRPGAYRMERINFSDILYIEGQGAYLRIMTQKAKIMTLQNFQNMESLLPSDNFIHYHSLWP